MISQSSDADYRRVLASGAKAPLVSSELMIRNVIITRVDMQQAVNAVSQSIQRKDKIFIAVPNVFVVVHANDDSTYKKVVNSADIAFPDGMPLVWASFLMGKYTGGRVCGPDFFTMFNAVAEKEKV